MIGLVAFLRALPWRYIAIAALLVAAVVGVYRKGEHASDVRWEAKEAKRALAQSAADMAQAWADAQALQARIKEDNQFVARALTAQAQLQDQFTTVQGVRRATQNQFRLYADRDDAGAQRLRLPGAACPVVVASARPGLVAGQDGTADGAPAQPAPAAVDGAGDSGPVLSLGAVWLWNAALTGQTDAAHTGAGACSIDAATHQASAACAAPSGVTLDAAWDNHIANAAACAADRLRHSQLIDFLTTREGTLP